MLNAETPARTVDGGAEDERPPASRIELPEAPERLRDSAVKAWAEPVAIDTYLPEQPSRFPEFLDRRVYQGSSGRVFPLPFHERISPTKAPRAWRAVHLENEFVRLMILPELGGRIHIGYDKITGYDFFYRNNVIKPALVGLAGPWISGGVEFNWPQHHRPATFLPVDIEVEQEPDGAVTVWCSDHDPFARMKGMHGVRLTPGSSVVEVRARLFNRTETPQTFLWWANVAARVHEQYQSFFPEDVTVIADHAKRAFATFPAVTGRYYGIDYPARRTPERPDGDRIDWYRNIPVPTSYMVVATEDDFFGGYDHRVGAGFVHWADRSIAPGKKQWTWGSEAFGRAWDANLTDTDGPYVELMAGVFTDNQPDFSFLAPGETKTFSQYWYPIAGTGPVHQATRDAAISVRSEGGRTEVTLAATAVHRAATLLLELEDGTSLREVRSVAPGRAGRVDVGGVVRRVTARAGDRELVRWEARAVPERDVPPGATEPPAPEDVASGDELVLIGEYLAQYRHATRAPEPYWQEALRRDPGDARANIALGWSAYRRARFDEAAAFAATAIARLTARVPNPSTGEAHYLLGLARIRRGLDSAAAEPLAKATWNAAWAAPAGLELARMALRAGDPAAAEERLRDVLKREGEQLQARDLLVLALRERGRDAEAAELLAATLALDPLDQLARHLAGQALTDDAPTLLDTALELVAAGGTDAALGLLEAAATASATAPLGQVRVAPLAHYHRAALLERAGRTAEAAEARAAARRTDGRLCQASRLEDVRALRSAVEAEPGDGRASLLLANWLYDKGDAVAAVPLWEVAAAGAGDDALIARRNLGIAAYNADRDPEAAERWFRSAVELDDTDAKLLQEYDQLLARRGVGAAARLARLEAARDVVRERDDLTVTYATLLVDAGRAEEARDILAGRAFQPWEGGEGSTLAAWERAMAALARRALASGKPEEAVEHARSAIDAPANLGEARHPLANTAELFLLLGDAEHAAGDEGAARAAWRTAAESVGDFVDLAPQAFSASTPASVRALRRLGDDRRAEELTDGFAAWIDELARTPAAIDYFATSLPTMLLFHDEPQAERDSEVARLRISLDELRSPDTDLPPTQRSGKNREEGRHQG